MLGKPYCLQCKQGYLNALHGGVASAGYYSPLPTVDPLQFIRWARLYDALGAFLGVLVVAYQAFLMSLYLNATRVGMVPLGWRGWLMMGIIGVFIIGSLCHLVAAFLLRGDRKWTYYLQWTVAVLAVPVIAGVFLIIYLLKPEIKAHFDVPTPLPALPLTPATAVPVSAAPLPEPPPRRPDPRSDGS